MKTSRKLFVAVLVCLITMSTLATAWPRKPVAKNVILLIGDGLGFNHIRTASYYQYRNEFWQVYKRFPFKYAMSTYMAYYEGECTGHGYDPERAWSEFEYVKDCATDSAAAATAMSTGVKTYGGAIGVGLDWQPRLHVLEYAEDLGKATGVVTSVEFSHATPAGFVAHNVSRSNYAEIAREIIYDSAVDVVMGCGHPWYDQDGQPRDIPNTYRYVGGADTWDELVAGIAGGDADADGNDDPWLLIQTRAEFKSLMNGPTPKRVAGVPQVYETLQQARSGNAYADPFVVPLVETVPTLEEMTRAALNILDDDPDGLFLMIEGGAIDWAGHANQSGRVIEEQIHFEKAVKSALEWVKQNSDWRETLVIVTADHETGYLTGPGSDPTWQPILNNGAGNLPGMEWHSSGHTNSLVAFFARGRTAWRSFWLANERDPVYGRYLDNTEVARLVFWAMAPP